MFSGWIKVNGLTYEKCTVFKLNRKKKVNCEDKNILDYIKKGNSKAINYWRKLEVWERLHKGNT